MMRIRATLVAGSMMAGLAAPSAVNATQQGSDPAARVRTDLAHVEPDNARTGEAIHLDRP